MTPVGSYCGDLRAQAGRQALVIEPTAALQAALPKRPVPSPPLWQRPAKGEWTLDTTGSTSDPINFYVHGTLSDLKARFRSDGWTEAAKSSLGVNLAYIGAAVVKECAALVNLIWRGMVCLWNLVSGSHLRALQIACFRETIQTMPVSAQTLHGSSMLTAFERDNHPLGGRHHFRIFDTGTVDPCGREVFAIAASRDIGIRMNIHRPTHLFFDHQVAKDTDTERDFVLPGLFSADQMHRLKLDYGAPGQATGDDSQDGIAYDVVLRNQRSETAPELIAADRGYPRAIFL